MRFKGEWRLASAAVLLPAVLVPAVFGFDAAGAGGEAARTSGDRPKWDVSGRWDGFNGAEYVIFRQHRGGRLGITVHHTCAAGHVERGSGRIRGDRVRGRVEPAGSPPPGCARFATIDVGVDPDGLRMRGRYRTDADAGALLYIGKQRARTLVRFRPRIAVLRGGRVQVLLRARPPLPSGARARVSLCLSGACVEREGRYGPVFRRPPPALGTRCSLLRAHLSFAGARASASRRICDGD